MTIYAYLRVSTDEQDVKNQKHGILEYANVRGLSNIVFIEDKVSSKMSWADRKIGELINNVAKSGDIILCAEISRIARRTLEILEMLEVSVKKEIQVHIIKEKLMLDDSLMSQIACTIFGMTAQIERTMIQERTKETLAQRKREIDDKGYFISKEGKKITSLGRPKNSKGKLKLDDEKEEIAKLLGLGVSKRAICKMHNVTFPTLQKFIKRHGLKT